MSRKKFAPFRGMRPKNQAPVFFLFRALHGGRLQVLADVRALAQGKREGPAGDKFSRQRGRRKRWEGPERTQ